MHVQPALQMALYSFERDSKAFARFWDRPCTRPNMKDPLIHLKLIKLA